MCNSIQRHTSQLVIEMIIPNYFLLNTWHIAYTFKQHNEDISDRLNLLDGKNKRNGHLNLNTLGAIIGIIGIVN